MSVKFFTITYLIKSIKRTNMILSNKINKQTCHCFLSRKKPEWITQFNLIFNRSLKCFLRSYQTKLLELGTILVITIFYL